MFNPVELLVADLRLRQSWTRLQRRIENALASVSDGLVKVRSDDTTPNYLSDKIVGGIGGVTPAVLNPGGDEKLEISVPSLPGPIARTLTVGLSGGVDYTSLKAAIDAAILGGASATSPWLVKVYPGTYVEQPMVIQPGICLVAEANRITTAIIQAANPAADLFTCSGGYIAGIRAEGVTDPARALFRCATNLTRTVFHGVGIRACSTGIAVSGGAAAIITNFSATIEGPGQGITTAISVIDANSYLAILGAFFSVPPAVLPGYGAVNPIQTCIACRNGANANVTGAVFLVAHNDNTADAVFVDGGARIALFSSECEGCANGVHIGAAGANTRAIVQGARFVGNVNNGVCDSATGVFLVSAAADDVKLVAVPGTKLSGLIQTLAGTETLLAGDVNYSYPNGTSLSLEEYLHEFGSTGLAYGGEVTVAGPLSVNVAAGEGYCSRIAQHDIENVEWSAVAGLALTDNAINYVYYDEASASVTASVASPGSSDILLATVVAQSGAIKYLHKTRNVLYQPEQTLHDYLVHTRRIIWSSGLAVSAGSGPLKFNVASGSYYVATELISVSGAADAQFWYYYGPGSTSQVPGLQSVLDNTQYDNYGVLTAMTAGWFRADTIIITSDNVVSVVYGTRQFATQAEAEDPSNAQPIPDFLSPTGCYTFLAIVQQGAGIVSFFDVRSGGVSGPGGGSGTNNHSALLNLLADDHPQYLRTDGVRAMTGPLDVGGNGIVNPGLVDGVNVPAHGSRHNPGAVDAIATGTPVSVLAGVAPSPGTAPSVSLSDHQHGIAVGIPVGIGTANLPGTSSSVSASDHQHNHGAQTDPTHHAVVTPFANGFMSAADKSKLDGISPTVVDATDTILSPVLTTGSAATFTLANTYSGATFNVPRDCAFANAYVRLTASNAGSIVRVTIYQRADGNSGVASLVATGSAIATGGATSLVIPLAGSLVRGIAYVLVGRDNATTSTMRTYGNTAMDGLNQNVPAGKAPVSFTTAIASNGAPPATFDPTVNATASSGTTAAVIRLGA
jgi:hypothetical protein